MTPITLPGVPDTVKFDSWWMDEPPLSTDPAPHAKRPAPMLRLGILAALVLAADLLFWGHGNGVNVAVFAALIFAASAIGLPWRQMLRPGAIMVLGTLPVVDMVQPLSVIILAIALMVSLVLLHHPGLRAPNVLQSAAKRTLRLPVLWFRTVMPVRMWSILTENDRPAPTPQLPAGLRTHLRNWAFPAGGALVFSALVIRANPVFEQALLTTPDLSDLGPRILFWAGIAVLCAPFLLPAPAYDHAPTQPNVRLPNLGINAASTLRALITFNLVIGLQTLSDLTIFLGGAALPDGMTHAEYAHRGAYPLLATALLAGGFALAARPFLGEHRAIRPLMVLWLGQNVALCLSALLRLDLYIDAFGATYLRLYALIWMALTVAILLLIGWQTLRGRSAAWLVVRGAALGALTLYTCAFVNFAQMIAAQNLSREKPDLRYVCGLGDFAAGPIDAALQSRMRICYAVAAPTSGSWQEWGWRKARVNAYLAETATQTPAKTVIPKANP